MESSFVKLIKSPAYASFLKKLIMMSIPVLLIGLIIKNNILIEVGGGTLALACLYAIPAIIYKRRQRDKEDNNDSQGNQ